MKASYLITSIIKESTAILLRLSNQVTVGDNILGSKIS